MCAYNPSSNVVSAFNHGFFRVAKLELHGEEPWGIPHETPVLGRAPACARSSRIMI